MVKLLKVTLDHDQHAVQNFLIVLDEVEKKNQLLLCEMERLKGYQQLDFKNREKAIICILAIASLSVNQNDVHLLNEIITTLIEHRDTANEKTRPLPDIEKLD